MKNNKGFTLIETLIYLVLFFILIGGGMVAAYGIIESSDRTSARTITEQEGIYLLRKLGLSLTGASAEFTVSVPSSTRLQITKGGVTNEFRFNSASNSMEFGSGGTFMTISSKNVKLSNLIFTKTSSAGRPDSIKYSFTLTGTKKNAQNFEATKYLR